jgi:Peptidase M15
MSDGVKLPGITKLVNFGDAIYQGSNFTWGEALRDGERMPVDTRFEGEIITAATITANVIKMARELDKIRAQFGNRPVTVTSWLRPPAVNKKVGGVRNSQHLLGWAVDIQIQDIDPHDVAAKLMDSWPGGLGDSESFTHLDLRQLRDRSLAMARWDYGNA